MKNDNEKVKTNNKDNDKKTNANQEITKNKLKSRFIKKSVVTEKK